MKHRALLTVISGFAGSGKGSAMKGLLEKYPDTYALSVSATTREPRPGEVDGREYFFLSDEAFEEKIRAGELLEHAGYVGHYYGTPRAYVEENLAAGKDVLLEIEIQGALQVRKQFPSACLLFLTPPSADELKRRLVGRGTEDAKTIQKRLSRAVEEADGMEQYDYLIVNDDLDTCIETIHHIIQSEKHKVTRCREEISDIREGVRAFS